MQRGLAKFFGYISNALYYFLEVCFHVSNWALEGSNANFDMQKSVANGIANLERKWN